MKTLYLSDLDGTLLNNEGVLPERSRAALNRLIARGTQFSVATARNTLSMYVLDGLRLHVPVSIMNGAVCYDTQKDEYFAAKPIDPDAFCRITRILRKHSMTGFAYGVSPKVQSLYYEPPAHFRPPASQYYEKRLRDKLRAPQSVKLIQAERLEDIAEECICFFTVKETYETLLAVRNEIQVIDGIYAPVYKDKYTDYWFVEVASGSASKAAAVHDLRAWGAYDRVVGFGDDVNDIPMLKACDEAYAVANAAEAVKALADGVIDSNEENGVANYLEQQFKTGASNV